MARFGLIGCAPTSQNAPLPATASSSQDAPLPTTGPSFESQTVASAATGSPMIESPPTAASRVSAGTDYKISSLDILQVAVFQVPDLNRTVRVDEAGFVSLPLVGQVPVRGKTMLQAQEDITARYGKSYLQSPQVSLSLVKSSQRVTVSGAVRSPTVLNLDTPLTLSMAIAQSGGTNDIANPERVHIARITGERVDDSVFDLKEIQAGQAPNPALRGGDIVVVEDSTASLALKESRISCHLQPSAPSLCPTCA